MRDFHADVDEFLRAELQGKCSLLLVPDACMTHAVLRHYRECQQLDSSGTSAYVAFPENVVSHARQHSFVMHAKQKFGECHRVVMHDAPAAVLVYTTLGNCRRMCNKLPKIKLTTS